MKSFHPALRALLPVFFLPILLSAQAPDTFHLTGCGKFWGNDHPVPNIRMQVTFQNNLVAGPGFGGDSGPDNACVEVSIPAAAVSGYTGFFVNGERLGPDDDVRNGLSVADLICLNRHILGLEPLPLYAQLAADVNKSGSIAGFDLVELRKVLLGIYPNFPNSANWRIVSPNCTFPNPANPFQAVCNAFPIAELPNYDGDTLSLVAVKVGDLDGDYKFDGPYQAPQGGNAVPLFMPALNLQAGDSVAIPVYLKQPLDPGGFQAGFRYNTASLSLFDIAPVQGTSDNWAVFAAQGLITNVLLTTGSPIPADTLAYLMFAVKKGGPLNQAIWLDSTGFTSIFSSGCGTGGPLELEFETASAVSAATAGIRISPAYPNPFVSQAIVQLELDQPTVLRLEVWDINGRLTHVQDYDLASGRQTVVIPAEAVARGSLGVYRLMAEGFTAVGKVMRK